MMSALFYIKIKGTIHKDFSFLLFSFFLNFARLHILRVTADQELPPERDAPISNLVD